MSMDSTWHELAIETALVIHVEQIIGGAQIDCHCGEDAVLFVTSEPDMEPGPVCKKHALEWIDLFLSFWRKSPS